MQSTYFRNRDALRGRTRSARIGAVAAVTGLIAAATATAGITTFTDSSAFSSSLPAGFFANTTWGGLSGFASGTQVFTGGSPSISYTARNAAGQAFYVDTLFAPPVLSTANGGTASTVVFDFNGGDAVYSVGGGFVVTDVNGTRVAGPSVNVTFWSGTNGTGTQLASATVLSTTGPTNAALPFFAITSTDPIGSLVASPSSQFIAINDFITAVSPVPEPSSLAIVAAGAACSLAVMTRRRLRSR